MTVLVGPLPYEPSPSPIQRQSIRSGLRIQVQPRNGHADIVKVVNKHWQMPGLLNPPLHTSRLKARPYLAATRSRFGLTLHRLQTDQIRIYSGKLKQEAITRQRAHRRLPVLLIAHVQEVETQGRAGWAV